MHFLTDVITFQEYATATTLHPNTSHLDTNIKRHAQDRRGNDQLLSHLTHYFVHLLSRFPFSSQTYSLSSLASNGGQGRLFNSSRHPAALLLSRPFSFSSLSSFINSSINRAEIITILLYPIPACSRPVIFTVFPD